MSRRPFPGQKFPRIIQQLPSWCKQRHIQSAIWLYNLQIPLEGFLVRHFHPYTCGYVNLRCEDDSDEVTSMDYEGVSMELDAILTGSKSAKISYLIANTNKYLDFGPLCDAARSVDAADFVAEQYLTNPDSSPLYRLPEELIREILCFICWDPTLEEKFTSRASHNLNPAT